MDFFKACHTNVHCIERLLQTPFRVYTGTGYSDGALDAWSRAARTVGQLRSQNILCALSGPQLWIFGSNGNNREFPIDQESVLWDLALEGNAGSTSLRHDGLDKPVDILLEAIEASIAFKLASESAIYRVGSWKWCHMPADGPGLDSAQSLSISLQPKLTSSGDLYIVSNIGQSPYSQMDALSQIAGTELVLAPFGLSAQLHINPPAKLPIEDDAWKSYLSQALRTFGVDVEGETEWIPVGLCGDGSGAAFLWPAHLCLAQLKTGIEDHDFSIESRDWRRWFISTEEGAIFRDPLAMAEEWYRASPERERAAAAAKQKGQDFAKPMADIAKVGTPDMLPTTDEELTTSPPFTQRAHDQAIMAGIYPTPPDGYVPAALNLQLNVATPSITLAEQNEVATGVTPSGHDPHAGATGNHSQLDHLTYEETQEDLFEDVDGIEFEENDVDDADFSFFDEPDEDPLAPVPQANQGVVERDVHMVSKASDPPPKIDGQRGIEVSTGAPEQDLDAAHRTVNTPKLVVGCNNIQISDTKMTAQPLPQFNKTPGGYERPLSPFGIRERLLPPPVPASIAHVDSRDKHSTRRNSTFAPIAFREGFELGDKYTPQVERADEFQPCPKSTASPDLDVSASRSKSRQLVPRHSGENSESDSEYSDESSYEPSSSDLGEELLPPTLPWETRKRKRNSASSARDRASVSKEQQWLDDSTDEAAKHNALPAGALVQLLQRLLHTPALNTSTLDMHQREDQFRTLSAHGSALQSESSESLSGPLPDLESFYDFSPEDVICIAQVVNEQAVSVLNPDANLQEHVLEDGSLSIHAALSSARKSTMEAIDAVLPASESYGLEQVALTRETLVRPQTNPNKAVAGQPRIPQRSDSTLVGPDYFQLPLPHVRVHRGTQVWEMLPTGLSFWEALGLAPASGPKNVRAFCVFPFNEDLQRLVERFLGDLATSYESSKLGSHVHKRTVSESDEQDNFENGMAPVDLSEDASLTGALKAYGVTCAELGKALSTIAQQEAERAVVVYITNPFSGLQARQHLCACFWLLWKAYRDNLPKQQRAQGTNDIVLQILPINLLAAHDALALPDAGQMAALAREVYDRCPPSAAFHALDNSSLLFNVAAPSVELAGSAPKRIGFQLAPEPPTDLLHEGSILHLAYVLSTDRQWLTATWIDSTGKHQSSTAFCMRGRSLAEVGEHVWEHTRRLLTIRQVMWRVFIVTTDDAVDEPILECWRTLATSKPLPQALCVTILAIERNPLLQLLTSQLSEEPLPHGFPDAGFSTPASTPTGNMLTSSPDVSGHSGNAPPTPAASEAATSIAENDPDAQLLDIREEAWAVMLDPKLRPLLSKPGLANGAIYKRGKIAIEESERLSEETLPALGVSLLWTIQVKPQGGVDEGSVKQAEMTLRDVLRLYRNLAVLTKAKGLAVGKNALLPVHIATAMKGAAGLEGFLPIADEEEGEA